jgi:hypothetical protein
MIYRYPITFHIAASPEGYEQVAVEAVATNAPDALIAAVTCVRQIMGSADNFWTITVRPPMPTEVAEHVQMPFAEIVGETAKAQ